MPSQGTRCWRLERFRTTKGQDVRFDLSLLRPIRIMPEARLGSDSSRLVVGTYPPARTSAFFPQQANLLDGHLAIDCFAHVVNG